MIDDDVVVVAEIGTADLRRMKTLMRKYRDLPMDFADAALVRVAERERLTRILTSTVTSRSMRCQGGHAL